MEKRKPVVPYNVDQIAEKIIWGVSHPSSLQGVRLPRSRPETMSEWLEDVMTGNNTYDEWEPGGHTLTDARSPEGHVPQFQPEDGVEENLLSRILSRVHQEKVYHFDIELYVTEFMGHMSFSIPVRLEKNYKRLVELTAMFLGQELGIDSLTAITSDVGALMRVDFHTDRPGEDFVFIDIQEGVELGLGMDKERKLIGFTKVGNDIVFQKY